MNTTPTTDQPTTDRTAEPDSRTRTIVEGVLAVLAATGITAGLILGLGATSTTPAPAPAPTAPAAAVITPHTAHHALAPTDGPATAPAHHVTPPAPPAPTAAIKTLQSELGQLNYYEGPITGTMTPQTVQAIDYLQRDAHLPQTGTMNAATQAALAHFLATGNNQMGS
jgi:peptidoglycan hydrolase-like protein with peptidoglycan-binding domain